MRIVITGAAGQIGRQIVEDLSGSHEVALIDRQPIKQHNSLLADLSHQPPKGRVGRWLSSSSRCWNDAFAGANAVVHLAADPRPSAPWGQVLSNNIHATWNVIEAAARHGVPRVMFASTNWVVKALEEELAPSCYLPDGPKIGSDVPPCPKTPYGLSKAVGETTGRMFVDEGRLKSFVAVRIGSYNPDPPKDEMLRARWIGVEDIRSLFRRCVEAEFEGFHVVYGVSAQKSAPYDLSHTRELLSWSPLAT